MFTYARRLPPIMEVNEEDIRSIERRRFIRGLRLTSTPTTTPAWPPAAAALFMKEPWSTPLPSGSPEY